MAKIPLTNRNLYALVDDEDFERVSRLRWHTVHSGVRLYVASTSWGKDTSHGDRILLHRFIMGAKKGQIIDHINGNPLDNRRANLRFCTASQNAENTHSHDEIMALVRECRAPQSERVVKGWRRRPDRDKPSAKGVHMAYEMRGGHVVHFPPGVTP